MKKQFIWMFLIISPVLMWAQINTDFSLDIGYQNIDVNGNEDVYNSQRGVDEGFLLRNFHYNLIQDKEAFFNRFSLDASGFDATDNGSLIIKADKAGIYSANFRFMRLEHFNALPQFANPFLSDGITPGQHTIDRNRSVMDFEVVLFPEKNWRPVIGYRWVDYSGDATTTYHIGQDEFALVSDLDEHETTLSLGLEFDFGKFTGRLMQGWRKYDGDETQSLAAGASAGNNLRQILGQDITLDSFNRTEERNADSPTTTLTVNGQVMENVTLAATYIKTDLESELSSDEQAVGNLASFEISRFFTGRNQTIASNTDGDQYLGKALVQVQLPKDFQARLEFGKSHRELDGQALVSSLYLDAVTFGNNNPADFMTQLDARTYQEKEIQTTQFEVVSPNLNGFRFSASYKIDDQDSIIDPDLAEIVVPGGQGGSFEREIKTTALSASYRVKKHEIKLDWQNRDADEIILRTDYLEYEKLALRISTKWSKYFKLVGKAQWLDQSNDNSDIGYDASNDRYGLDAIITPHKTFQARLSYGIYDYESQVSILIPQTFQVDQSIHLEDGDEIEADLFWSLKKWEAGFNFAKYETDGVLGYSLEQTNFHLGYTINKQFGLKVEFSNVEYTDDVLSLANYDADRFALILNWKR
ncbi:MAG: hypothetical protein KDC71_15855 [Acidobacteria bacterium]|nr:hypothetical protein [Acidobacteriota bacterium]